MSCLSIGHETQNNMKCEMPTCVMKCNFLTIKWCEMGQDVVDKVEIHHRTSCLEIADN